MTKPSHFAYVARKVNLGTLGWLRFLKVLYVSLSASRKSSLGPTHNY